MSLYLAKKKLSLLISFEPIWINICINTCYAYTGDYSNLTECLFYNKKCYQSEFSKKSCHQFVYFSIIDRLKI